MVQESVYAIRPLSRSALAPASRRFSSSSFICSMMASYSRRRRSRSSSCSLRWCSATRLPASSSSRFTRLRASSRRRSTSLLLRFRISSSAALRRSSASRSRRSLRALAISSRRSFSSALRHASSASALACSESWLPHLNLATCTMRPNARAAAANPVAVTSMGGPRPAPCSALCIAMAAWPATLVRFPNVHCRHSSISTRCRAANS
mmetsp:Transcript_4503/g.14533  ORF Transcript_4503/g.14533 Transcript_4503/m.14533 type:complete len:207 (-) Transcript_4503:544-1164(-)